MTRIPSPRAGPRHSHRRDDYGSTTIQMAALMPVLFLIMFTGLQAALYYYAATVAGAAAQDGARAAAAYTGSGTGNLAAGTAAAESALQQSHGSLSKYTVTSSGTVAGATVTVTGQPLSVIPGMTFTISRSATWPWERLS
jgi:Flp pilus assembly protein TadG